MFSVLHLEERRFPAERFYGLAMKVQGLLEEEMDIKTTSTQFVPSDFSSLTWEFEIALHFVFSLFQSRW